LKGQGLLQPSRLISFCDLQRKAGILQEVAEVTEILRCSRHGCLYRWGFPLL